MPHLENTRFKAVLALRNGVNEGVGHAQRAVVCLRDFAHNPTPAAG
jgi:hypothetical protein